MFTRQLHCRVRIRDQRDFAAMMQTVSGTVRTTRLRHTWDTWSSHSSGKVRAPEHVPVHQWIPILAYGTEPPGLK